MENPSDSRNGDKRDLVERLGDVPGPPFPWSTGSILLYLMFGVTLWRIDPNGPTGSFEDALVRGGLVGVLSMPLIGAALFIVSYVGLRAMSRLDWQSLKWGRTVSVAEAVRFIGLRGIVGMTLASFSFVSLFATAQLTGLVLAAHALSFDEDLWYVRDIPLEVALVVWLPLAAIAYPCNTFLYVKSWQAKAGGETDSWEELSMQALEEPDPERVSDYFRDVSARVSRWMAANFTDEVVAIALFVLASVVHSFAKVYSWLRKGIRFTRWLAALFEWRGSQRAPGTLRRKRSIGLKERIFSWTSLWRRWR